MYLLFYGEGVSYCMELAVIFDRFKGICIGPIRLVRSFCKLFNTGNILSVVNTFIYAGSTALLLLMSQLYSAFWFFSFVALIPLFIKACKSKKEEAILLGALFGLIYFTIHSLQIIDGNLFIIIIRVAFGTVLSTGFVYAVLLIRNNLGLITILISTLWVAFELILIKLGLINSLLGGEILSQKCFYGISALFGFLIISLIIVTFNALLIIAVHKIIYLAKSRQAEMPVSGRTWNLYTEVGIFAGKFYLNPDSRGPPVCTILN